MKLSYKSVTNLSSVPVWLISILWIETNNNSVSVSCFWCDCCVVLSQGQANRGWSTSASTSVFPATSVCLCASTTCPSDSGFCFSQRSNKRINRRGQLVSFFLLPFNAKKVMFEVLPCVRLLQTERNQRRVDLRNIVGPLFLRHRLCFL